MDSSNLSRRAFIQNSAAATALTMAVPTMLKAQNAAGGTSPNERLRIGFIGVGGRAQTHLDSAIELQNDGKVEIATICDVFNRYRDDAVRKVNRGRQAKAQANGRLSRNYQRRIHRRGRHRHARSLARPANDRRAQSRQARVLRKADDTQCRRGPRRA